MRGKARAFQKILSVALTVMLLLGITPLSDGVGTVAYGASVGISSNYEANVSVRVTMNNSPVQGITVYAENVTHGVGGSSTTNSNGDTVIRVTYYSQSAQFRFRVYAGSQNLAYTGEVFDLFGGTPPADIELTPVPVHDVSTTVRIDGNPAANVPVNLQMGYGTPYTAVSGPDGSVTFRDVPGTNSYQMANFYVEESDRYKHFFSRYFEIPAGPVPVIELAGQNKFSIQVADANGNAVSDRTRVGLYRRENAGVGTNAYTYNGVAEFSRIPSGTDYYFKVEIDNVTLYDGAAKGEYFDLPGTPPNIVVDLGQTMSTVVTLNGQPKAGVEVRLQGGKAAMTTQTSGADGVVTFPMVYPASDYYFTVRAGADYTQYHGQQVNKTFNFPGTVPVIELEGGHTVTTRVTLNGQPVADTAIWLCHEGLYGDIRGVTDADGNVTFTKVPAAYSYYFYMDGGSGYTYYDGSEKGRFFAVPGAAPAVQLEAGFSAATTVTLDGVPQAGTKVCIYKVSGDFFYGDELLDSDYTGADGAVTFEGLPGGRTLYFHVPGGNDYIAYSGDDSGKTFVLPTGNIPTIELDRGSAFETTVTFNGSPVPNQKVYLKSYDRVNYVLEQTTDAGGTVRFSRLPPSRRNYLYIPAPAGAPYADHSSAYFNLPGDGPGNLELEPANSISARVFLDGAPAAGISVDLWYRTATRGESKTALSDASGTVTFENLPVSQCDFAVSRVAGSHAKYSGERFSVPGAAPDIHLTKGNTVSTRVTMNGVPVSSVSVSVESANTYAHALSDANGNVVIENIRDDEQAYFRVHEQEGSYASYNGYYLGKTFSIPSASYPAVELSEGQTITTTVTYRGVPQQYARVRLWSQESAQGQYGRLFVRTDAQGRASFQNIGAGLYAWEAYDVSEAHSYNGTVTNTWFTIPGAVPGIELDPAYNSGGNTWRPGSGGSSGGGSGGGGGKGSPASGLIPTAPAPTTGPVSVKGATDLASEAVKQGKSSFRIRNAESASLEAMRAMVTAAGGAPLKFHADSTLNNGAVDVRITVDPARATKDIKLSASTISARARSVKAFFEKWYRNQVQVVSCAQQGGFGMPVEIAVKLDSKLVGKPLVFYSYDKEANTYRRIAEANYWIDGKGFVHFTTEAAGDIVVCDGELVRR